MSKRKVEVFTQGCSKCEPTIELVKSMVCDSCELVIYDVKKGCETNICHDLVKQYGVTQYPAVAVDGRLLDCCADGSAPTIETLKASGIGRSK